MKINWKLAALVLGLGFFFIYAPIVSLVVYSFNAGKLVTLWAGFSTQWYVELFHDSEILSATWLTLKIALATSFAAVAIGTLAGFVLARYKRFTGSTLFVSMVNALLVIPEVITGISMLLMFVSMEELFGWPAGRGFFTIWLGHTTMCAAYVSVVIRSRLKEMNRSLEEAAMDLGASPFTVFYRITLPIIMPALVAGWLLSFTLSIDDLVMTEFLAGPGSTTLPMVVFSRVRLGLDPKINALATILIVVVTIGVIVANRFMLNAEKRREKEMKMAFAND